LNLRQTNEERFALRFPFRPIELPPGQTRGFLETVDEGLHAEASVVQFTAEARYKEIFAARARVHALDLYRRNPTSEDRVVDADELWLRFGQKPEGLALPSGTSFFVQIGKAPKMERQPVRLLESYGVASTAFNRFEDIALLAGGSYGRGLYWRAEVSKGNPIFLRDSNALAGDNGVESLRRPNPNPRLKSGFPILYNAEVEGFSFGTENPQIGGGLGYRFGDGSGEKGVDLLLYHYRRELAVEADLTGTFYGGDLDLLDGTRGISLPIRGNDKRESGMRAFGKWGGLTVFASGVKQELAGLNRSGYELESGYTIPLSLGQVRGRSLITSIQPAGRVSAIINHFRGPATFVAPSVWWDWTKVDVGFRIGIFERYDLTVERASHFVDAPRQLDLDETLVTFRIRL